MGKWGDYQLAQREAFSTGDFFEPLLNKQCREFIKNSVSLPHWTLAILR